MGVAYYMLSQSIFMVIFFLFLHSSSISFLGPASHLADYCLLNIQTRAPSGVKDEGLFGSPGALIAKYRVFPAIR